MTDEIELLRSRIAELESRELGHRARISRLEDEAVRSRRARSVAQDADLLSRLDPGPLVGITPTRGGSSRIPALATPLLQRLRDDASLPGLPSRPDPIDYPNLLVDPLFDTWATPGALTGSYVDHGARWQGKRTLNSGTAPVTCTLVEQSPRGTASAAIYGFESSVLVIAGATWGVDACDLTMLARNKDTFLPQAAFLPSWLTASVRIVPEIVTGLATATAMVEIVDNAETVLAQSDDVDLLEAAQLSEAVLLSTGAESPSELVEYRWRLRIDVTKDAGAVAELSVAVANPLLAYSDDGTPPSFTPAVGFFWT